MFAMFLISLVAALGLLGILCYLFLLLVRMQRPRTRVSLYYFVNNSNKLNRNDLDRYARTNFTIRAPDGVAVLTGNNNSHTHLAGMLEVLNRDNIPNGACIYDLPNEVANKIQMQFGA